MVAAGGLGVGVAAGSAGIGSSAGLHAGAGGTVNNNAFVVGADLNGSSIGQAIQDRSAGSIRSAEGHAESCVSGIDDFVSLEGDNDDSACGQSNGNLRIGHGQIVEANAGLLGIVGNGQIVVAITRNTGDIGQSLCIIVQVALNSSGACFDGNSFIQSDGNGNGLALTDDASVHTQVHVCSHDGNGKSANQSQSENQRKNFLHTKYSFSFSSDHWEQMIHG